MIFTPKVCRKQTFEGKKQTFKGKSQRQKWRYDAKNLTSYRLYRLLGSIGAQYVFRERVPRENAYEV